MYSLYEASLKDYIISMTDDDKDKLIIILEEKNGISFNDDRLNAILKHLYLLDLVDADNIIKMYISSNNSKSKIKWSDIMNKLKNFFNSEIGVITIIVCICFVILFFGLKSI